MNLNDINTIINVNFSKRFSYKEKVNFSKFLYSQFPELEVNAFEGSYHSTKLHNIVIGDLDNSNTVYATSLDTPQRLWFNYKYYPFDNKQERRARQKSLLISFILSLLFVGLGFMFFYLSTKSNQYLYLAIMFISLLISYLLIRPLGNKNNANRNNGSISLLLDLAQNNNIPVVLLDKTAESSLGYQLLEQVYPNIRKKKVVILDCVSSKNDLSGITNMKINSSKVELKTTDQLPFSNCIKLSRVDKLNADCVVNTATSKDIGSELISETLTFLKDFIREI